MYEDGFLGFGVVEEADVLVHVEDVFVRQAFDIFGYVENLLEILILNHVSVLSF